MSRLTFSDREIKKASNEEKTVMSFQYIEGKNGRYLCNGSLIQVAEFIAGAVAKILLMSDIPQEDIVDFRRDFSKRIQKIYDEHK